MKPHKPISLLTSLLIVFACMPSYSQGDRGGFITKHDRREKRTPSPPSIPVKVQPPTTSGVRVFGHWPPTGWCDFTLTPQNDHYQGLPNPACNDTTSGVDVPFGMSLEICEHDGQGSAGRGKCRRFLPGTSGVGGDINDLGTSYKVESRMYGYMNSADYPTGISITIGVGGTDPGVGTLKPTGKIWYDGTWITQENHLPLPGNCPKPKVVELTKAGDANWGNSIANNTLNLWMKIRPKQPFGANNWVGVEIVCQ